MDTEDAQTGWQTISRLTKPEQFKDTVLKQTGQRSLPLRSIYWKTFLLFETADHTEWLRRLGDSRSAYVSLRGHFLRGIEHADGIEDDDDPLSEDTKSPWAARRGDEELRSEIRQDVDRCMPENLFFRQPTTQQIMINILFIFCKLNPDVGYRQGMHELLAPVLWVVHFDAQQASSLSETEASVLEQLCDSRFIEHDSFTLLSIVMQNAKSFYEQKAHRAGTALTKSDSTPVLENPIITRVTRIFDNYLRYLDPELAIHLHQIEVIPQVFLMRWIRLLLGREFPFDDVLQIWDVIFAEDASLEIVDVICLIMILRIRWELLDADYNAALTLLLRYPTGGDDVAPRDLAVDAAELRRTFTPQFAQALVKKYSGRDMSPDGSLPDPETFAALDIAPPSTPSRRRIVTPVFQKQVEHIFQDAAKGMLSRGERWGINKAVRDAVDEVRKGVKDIQSMPTPQAPRRHSRVQSRGSTSGTSGRVEARLAALQRRNEDLAKMLKDTTEQLWDIQKVASEGDDLGQEKVKEFGMAIAKVQFVQVYLEDPTIPLVPEKEDAVSEDPHEPSPASDLLADTPTFVITDDDDGEPTQAQRSKEPSANPELSRKEAAGTSSAAAPANGGQLDISDQASSPAIDLQKERPTLAQSSFSWMLGQGERVSDLLQSGSSTPPNQTTSRSRGFLFGDDGADDDSITPASVDASGSASPARSARRGKERKAPKRLGNEDDGFDMSSLK